MATRTPTPAWPRSPRRSPRKSPRAPQRQGSGLHRIDAWGIDTVLARGESSGAQYPGVAAEARGHILVTSQFLHSAGSVCGSGRYR